MELLRGRVYLANLSGEGDEPELWIVVSNNARNKGLRHGLAARVTTTNKYATLDTVAQIPDGECIHGWALADSMTWLYSDEPIKEIGALSREAMRHVERALRAALDLI